MFAISFPGADALKTIYLNILNAHLTYMDMGGALLKISERVVEAAVGFNSKVFVLFLFYFNFIQFVFFLDLKKLEKFWTMKSS